jgi:hypothetical protein
LEKKSKYFNSNVELFSNSIRIFNQYDTWNINDLMLNHSLSVKKLMVSYGISGSDEELIKAMEQPLPTSELTNH